MSDNNMFDCAAVAPYLSPFADGELAEPMRSEVAAHVAACEDCASRLDRIRAVDQLIARLPHTTPSAGVFERTLAAATSGAPADPRGVTREALPGIGIADLRRRMREIVAPELSGEDTAEAPVGEHLASTRRRGRAPWLAAAIPAVAALLLITLAATLFNRFPSFPSQSAPSHATPNTASSLQQTQSAVNALASQLAFIPVSPTYLPAGASAPKAIVGPAEQVQSNSRYLDVTWTFTSGPVQSLHLRELPAGLGFDGYAPASGDAATALAWSLPQAAGWRQLVSSTCSSCLAVGETGKSMQLALDAHPRGAASADAVAVWLRLVSLSLDAPYKPITTPLAPPDSSLALRYQAAVADGQGHTWQLEVSTLSTLGAPQNARIMGNGADITEIVNGGSGWRLDNTTHTYERLAPPLPTVQPPHSVTQPLIAANDFVAAGELWNLGVGPIKLPDGRSLHAYDLFWVNAAQPEHIYVDAATGQAVALVVTSPSSAHPGGANGAQAYVSTTACQPYTVTYTFIEYVPQNLLPSAAFAPPSFTGWKQGSVAPAFTCQG